VDDLRTFLSGHEEAVFGGASISFPIMQREQIIDPVRHNDSLSSSGPSMKLTSTPRAECQAGVTGAKTLKHLTRSDSSDAALGRASSRRTSRRKTTGASPKTLTVPLGLMARYNRKDLYEKVWSYPMRTVAKEFGVSDVALAKTCRKLHVPAPGRGYWAKKAANHPVGPRPSLPIL
jgi:hypothetical protein